MSANIAHAAQPFKTPFKWLGEFTSSSENVVLGMISGTSMDGVDVAAVRCVNHGERFELLEFFSNQYPQDLVAGLKSPAKLDSSAISELHVRLGVFFGECALRAIETLRARGRIVSLIGSHGQTIYHHSCVPNSIPSTLQIADGDQIAALTEVPVVSDFRTKDIALGGQGAPLTPYGDWILFKSLHGTGAVLNIGGIANLTFLTGNEDEVTGFDTGPGNAPLDRLVAKITNGAARFDDGGKIASSGHVDQALLDVLLNDNFLTSPPPKSTGFEMYGDAYLDSVISRAKGSLEDLLATLTCFVARSIVDSINRFQPFRIKTLVVAGGGALNTHLVGLIRSMLADVRVVVSDEFGVPLKAREAMCFAIMAHNAAYGINTSLPSVTGAQRGASLGKWSFY
jgi:anhydro-N-acetylmuramic acid kinase